MRKNKAFIFRVLCLIAYIICVGVLIFEASMDGKSSANQSNAVGGAISNVVNDVNGDQTVAVNPTKVEITNDTDGTIEGKTGGKIKLELVTTPEDATYQSYIYESADSTIAEVDANGNVYFKKEGTTSITVINESFREIKDTITINVTDIKVETINIKLKSNTKDIIDPIYNENETYELFLGYDYKLEYNIDPSNATIRDASFSIDENDYVSLENNILSANNLTHEAITITATCACGNISTSIKVIVVPTQEIKLNEIYLKNLKNDENPKLETFVTKPITTSFMADYRVYDLTTVDDLEDYTNKTESYSNYTIDYADEESKNIVTISGTKITGKTLGEATIIATSTDDTNITYSFKVSVAEQPELQSFTLPTEKTYTYVEGKIYSLSITLSGDAKYHLINSSGFVVSDDSVITITKKTNTSISFKVLKANSTTTITATINGIEKTTTIKTIKPAEIKDEETGDTLQVLDFKITQNNDNVFLVNSEIDIKNLYSAEWYDTNEEVCDAPSGIFTYSINDGLDTIENGILKPTKPGKIEITISFEGFTDKTITIYTIDSYELYINDTLYKNETINLDVSKSLKWKIKSNNSDIQSFEVSYTGPEGSYNTIKYANYYELTSNNDGQVIISIVPKLDDEPNKINKLIKTKFTKTITVNMNHILVKSITAIGTITHYNSDPIEFTFEKAVHLNDKIQLHPIINEDATISYLTYKSSDSSIVKISKNGEITLLKTGEVKITITDEISNIETERTLIIIHKIVIDEDNPISITGEEREYDEKTKTIKILNGFPGYVKVNFGDDSTYTNVTYSSSNEKVLTIGKDGTITPKSLGKAIITIVCDDNPDDESQGIVYEMNVVVKRQDALREVENFFYLIRKGLGHFGAFLVLGIFSTFTYMLFFKHKKWLWSIPVNVAAGYTVAWLTEFIQKFVPGRSGRIEDVYIDFAGFMFSTIILTISILFVYLIIYLKNRKRQN